VNSTHEAMEGLVKKDLSQFEANKVAIQNSNFELKPTLECLSESASHKRTATDPSESCTAKKIKIEHSHDRKKSSENSQSRLVHFI